MLYLRAQTLNHVYTLSVNDADQVMILASDNPDVELMLRSFIGQYVVNPPIEIGKQILTANAHTTRVTLVETIKEPHGLSKS